MARRFSDRGHAPTTLPALSGGSLQGAMQDECVGVRVPGPGRIQSPAALPGMHGGRILAMASIRRWEMRRPRGRLLRGIRTKDILVNNMASNK
jgi:hypothetical protein